MTLINNRYAIIVLLIFKRILIDCDRTYRVDIELIV